MTGVLPNGLFGVELDDGRKLTAYLSGPMRTNIVRLIAGDGVTVEVSAFDPRKARIVGLRKG